MLVPYTDASHHSRRPTLAIPAGTVLQVGSDSSGKALGLHPKLTGCGTSSTRGAWRSSSASATRTRAARISSAPTSGRPPTRRTAPGSGWVGRYLATLPPPLDPLVAWNTTGDTPHALQSSAVSVASIPSVSGYAFSSPNSGSDGDARTRRGGEHRVARAGGQAARRVRQHHRRRRRWPRSIASRRVGSCKPTVAYPNNGFGQALQAIAGAMAKGIGTQGVLGADRRLRHARRRRTRTPTPART